MSGAAEVVAYFAEQAEHRATATGYRRFRVAAKRLRALAAKMTAEAEAERRKKARQRKQLTHPDLGREHTHGPGAKGCKACGDTWTASKRTDDTVTLRRKS